MLRSRPHLDRTALRQTLGSRVLLAGQLIRSWLSAGLAAALISGLGIAVAMVTDLTAPPKVRATEGLGGAGSGTVGPPPIEPYDPARGAAAVRRLETPAQTKALGLQRRYRLAVDHQTLVERIADSAEERRRQALLEQAEATEEEQNRIFQEEERRRIRAIAARKVAQQLAEQLRAAEAAAAEEAQRQRQNGQEPPAGGPDFDGPDFDGPDVDGPDTDGAGGETSGQGGAMPVSSGVIGAVFGAVGSWSSYHTGVDFRAGYGEPVFAAASGVVVEATNSGDWSGNHVAIRHAGGITTMSSHLSSIGVTVGQPVRAGQVIGRVGQTGRAFGPHLHFEVYPAGVRPGDVYQAVDPVPWLRSVGVNAH